MLYLGNVRGLMKDKERPDQTEVHRVNTGKHPKNGRDTDTEKKDHPVSDAAKEASRTDDTIV